MGQPYEEFFSEAKEMFNSIDIAKLVMVETSKLFAASKKLWDKKYSDAKFGWDEEYLGNDLLGWKCDFLRSFAWLCLR